MAMNTEPDNIAATNPFATRWVRPGAIPFHFPSGESLATLLDRLRQQHGWGEIVGPHGSGKSTLLAALRPALEQSGRQIVWFELHDGQRRLPPPWPELCVTPQTTVIVDGYEQLSWWQAWRLRRHVRRHGGGLVVTTHQPRGLPRLFETHTSLALAEELTHELLATHPSRVTDSDVERLFNETHGDIRETFFRLYDVHELRR